MKSRCNINQPTNITFQPIDWTNLETIGKAISGASIWLLLFVFGISSEIKKSRKITGLIISIAIFLILAAFLFAWIGALIPTIISPWVNYILFPIIQIVVLVFLTRKSQPQKGDPASETDARIAQAQSTHAAGAGDGEA